MGRQLQYALQLHAYKFFVSSVQMCATVPQLGGCQQRVWHCHAKDYSACVWQCTSSVSLIDNLIRNIDVQCTWLQGTSAYVLSSSKTLCYDNAMNKA